jgi:pullulanase/glycogen debranching enzyme
MNKNMYLVLLGILLISFASCKKSPNSGNDTGNSTTVTSTSIPSGAGDGVTFINSGKSVIFNLYAPNNTSVAVIGDFNNWTPTAMTKTTDGTRWWVQIDNLNPSTEYSYQYLINGTLKVADPYSHKILDPVNDPGIPTTVYPNLKAYPTGKTTGEVTDFYANDPAYSWQVTSFTPPAQKNLVIYELLVRDFVATHSYQTLTDTLNYIAKLGVNAIELMPVNEFEGNDSWGYNSNFMFALDKYYGTPNAYKAFIDACHAKGIAVIQDIVLEDQFGSSPMVQMYATSTGSPAANNPWFDQTILHPDAVGYQLNHSLPATQYFTENVMKYWMQEYHIDGFRFDQAKGYTQVNSGSTSTPATEAAWAAYDATRVALWTKYNAYMKSLNPNFYVILEMFAANQEEAQYASQGMMCWTDLSSSGEQATMGYPSNPSWDISGLFYDGYGFPSSGSSPYGLVSYFESHDEERLQFKNGAYGNSSGSYNVQTLATGLQRDAMGATFMFSSPGPKMVWQFGELGYDISINQNGRTGDKPILWNYNTDPNRLALYSIYQKMINMKIKNPVFATTNFTYSLSGAVKVIQLLDPTADVEVIGNFDVVSNTAVVTFPATGTWIDNLTGATYNVTSTSMTTTLAPGEYHVYSNVALKQ